jgi:hypothetical protein
MPFPESGASAEPLEPAQERASRHPTQDQEDSRKHGYPPDKTEKATEEILEQAELPCQAVA